MNNIPNKQTEREFTDDARLIGELRFRFVKASAIKRQNALETLDRLATAAPKKALSAFYLAVAKDLRNLG
jgi:hypothetical protein